MSKFVTICTYTSPWDAHIAMGRLESEGIPVFLAHEQHIWMNWMYSNALGGVKLQVTSLNAGQAYEIINAINSGEYEEALREQFPDMKGNACPQCGCEESISKFSTKTITLIIFMFFACSVIFPARRDKHSCLKCGQKWND